MRPGSVFLWSVSCLLALVLGASAARAGAVDDGVAALGAKDYEKALRLLRPAADKGDARGQRNLGVMYQNGYGLPRSYEDAVKWYR